MMYVLGRIVRAAFLAVMLTLIGMAVLGLSAALALLVLGGVFVAGLLRWRAKPVPPRAPMRNVTPGLRPGPRAALSTRSWAGSWDRLERAVSWGQRRTLRSDRAAIERLVGQVDTLVPGSGPHDIATWSLRLPDQIGDVLDAVRDGDDRRQMLDPLLAQIAGCAARARAADPILVDRRNRIAVHQRYFDERLSNS